MSMAIKAKLSAKSNVAMRAINILGAAEGFLPKALMLAAEAKAKTIDGPKTERPKIRIKPKFLSIATILNS